MDREQELIEIEKWENQQVDLLIKTVNDYCDQYQEVRRKTLKFIKELEKAGLKVKSYTIEKKGEI